MGYQDANGVYIYEETDEVSPLSEFENMGQRSISVALTDQSARIDSLADTAWSAYTPTLININKGATGVIVAEWRGDANSVDVRFSVKLGGTGLSVATDPGFTLPTPAVAPLHPFAAYAGIGVAYIGTAIYPAFPIAKGSSATEVLLYGLAPNTSGYINMNATTPGTFASGSVLSVQFSYRPA